MEVKITKKLNKLPKVFLTEDLVKFSTVDRFLNCTRYSSRSGLTQSGCLEIDRNEISEVRGIYYIPVKPYLEIYFRRKEIRDEEDVKKILESLPKPLDILGIKLLVYWDNYEILIYDQYVKGKKYGFPLLAKQGHLSAYQIPEPKNIYKVIIENDKQVTELDKEKFEETKELQIYNHKIIFGNNVLRYNNLHRFGGDGEIIFIPQSMMIRLESQDHETKEFSVSHNAWILFSHPKPKQNIQD